MPPYVPLHVQSAYSLGRGTAPVERLVDQAVLYGHDALALTDRNNLYGAVAFTRACRERGVRPILGAEVDGGGAPSGRAGLDARDAHRPPAVGSEDVVTLLVCDAEGYANLCRLITRRMMESRFRLAPALAELHRGLHVLVADPALLSTLASVIPHGSLWGELQAPRHGEPAFAAVADAARALNIDTVATGAVTCLHREDHRLHATLTAIRENTLASRLTPADLAPREAYFKAPAAMASVFRRHPGALANTRRVAESCAFTLERKRWIFPDPPLPGGETATSHLRALCEAGFARRYGARHAAPAAAKQLNRELEIIERLGFSSYFVVVGEIVRFGRARGVATVGRGSGASAVTAYVLGITNVDPIRYGLAFERFLHEKRPDWPDLDVDLCWKRRDEVIEHVYAAYGRDRVAMISTHNTFGTRSAFREAAKAHGIANRTVDRLSRCVPHAAEVPLREALKHAARGREIPREEPPWPQVLEQAERLVGLPRHLGLHPGGIVIADAPLDRYVPLEEAAKGIVCTQFEMRAIEAVGLVKIDLLGNRAISTIQETVELVAAERGVRLDPDAFPHEDAATASLMSSGDTLGVFQMESPGMRNLNRMLATRDLATTIAAVALIRPGPAASGMKERFCRRARGLEPVTYPDPRLEPVLRETFGVPLYEEDVMRIAATVTGLTLEDGDVLRRAIAGGFAHAIEEMRGVFLSRAQRRRYLPETARAIWDGLLQFGTFAFCKAHAAGYGVLAWQAGWLKAHYPAEFSVALMNHHAGMYDKRTHLEDAKRRGVAVLLPDVNHSEEIFTVERGAIRIGLERVRGLRVTARDAILGERGRRPFASLEDFLARVPVTRPELEALVAAGAFDFTGRTRPELFCLAASAFALFRRAGRREAGGDLFELEALPQASWDTPTIAEFSREERLWLEWSVLGLCAHDHPMRAFRAEPALRATVPLHDAETRVGKRVRVAGLVAARRAVPTRQGRQMLFVTLEDETGLLECTLFPPVYARHRGVVRDLGPYVAEGRIEEQYGAPTLNTERIARVRTPAFNASAETLLVRTGDRRTP